MKATRFQTRRPGGWQQADQPDAADAPEWFAGRLPDGWFSADPVVVVDREEITVVGRLAEAADDRHSRGPRADSLHPSGRSGNDAPQAA